MKNKILVVMSLTAAFALAGCESTPTEGQPQLKETVNYTSTKYQGDPSKVDYSVRSGAQLGEPRYLLEDRPLQPNNQMNNQQSSGGGSDASTQAAAPVTKPVEEKKVAQAEEPKRVIIKQPKRQERIKITGVGYGAESTYEGFTVGQKRLMAIRSSKLDAYRSLAEQLYGIKIDSNTSVATMTAQSDSFRARVNAVVKGARIVSITPMSDNNYETVLEVFVDRRFFEDVFVYTGNQHDHVLEPMETCNLGFNCYEAASYR